ncbi:LacI family DNA-binding transcriptional regulator [Pseudalkalibacillus hwajinpoensis]|uniref:LacI family DNA-binding transcriptional regulator n=1 Tax=Guptibacillus hwajinpoensis TaxID=208199 RepID=UPI00325A71A4
MTKIKDIAKQAGVSTATVSHVLNNTGRVGESTRQKVLEVINELNYKPNKIAKSLKIKKTSTVGVIAEDVTVFNTPDIIDGINEIAENSGLGILLSNLRIYKKMGIDFSQKEHMKELLSIAFDEMVKNQVDGIIYIGTYTRDVTDVIPANIPLPVVYTYCYTSNELDYTVNYDDEFAAYEATRHLIDSGHKEIALISGIIDSIPSHERFNGYRRALMDYGIPLNPSFVKTGDWEVDSGFILTEELLNLAKKPTAILALNDLMAFGSINAAKNRGLHVPDDISIIGFDNREFSAFTTPGITTMSIPLHQMGEKSMDMLKLLIANRNIDKKKIKLHCDLLKRESVSKK